MKTIESDKVHLIPEGSTIIEKSSGQEHILQTLFTGVKIAVIQTPNCEFKTYMTWEQFRKEYVLPE
jgi:hypothetical protein